ncbi:MAG: hypothetical protein PHI66_03505 [Candidatus Pacebacteria bacterium]|nr:hypothetical protein [Candidatus Paceibacterota bacterium]
MKKDLFLNLDFSQAALSAKEIAAAEAKVSGLEIPFFAKYTPDFDAMSEVAKKYQSKKNIIVEGNGGSISTMRAFWNCFGNDTDKNVFLLDTDDPDFIADIKNRCQKDNTLLIVVNRSGNNIQTISGYLTLRDYETIFVTANESALYKIGLKHNIPLYNTTTENPQMAGRFSGNTEFSLIPAAIAGINIKEISKGASETYEKCAPNKPFSENPALQFALALDKLEKLGYTELFLSIYSKKLYGFFELIIQLFHESVCKDGKGQTFYGGDAPENQHHTLQRFNSGRKNSAGIFMTVENFKDNTDIKVPDDIKDIECRGVKLAELEKLSMQDIIHTEFKGTWKDTTEQKIPAINIKIDEVTPENAGRLTAFLQYVTYYSAVLRDVDPFNQPGVEKSKEYIFKLVAEK